MQKVALSLTEFWLPKVNFRDRYQGADTDSLWPNYPLLKSSNDLGLLMKNVERVEYRKLHFRPMDQFGSEPAQNGVPPSPLWRTPPVRWIASMGDACPWAWQPCVSLPSPSPTCAPVPLLLQTKRSSFSTLPHSSSSLSGDMRALLDAATMDAAAELAVAAVP